MMIEQGFYPIKGKIIFLDVDGVIATPQQIHRYAKDHGGSCPPGLAQIDMECMRRLKQIVDASDAKIVISSTWRKLDHDMIDLLTIFNKFSIPLIGATSSLKCGLRGREITDFMTHHSIDMDDVLVLDDDTADLKEYATRQVVPDGHLGLSDEDVVKAIDIINNSFGKASEPWVKN